MIKLSQLLFISEMNHANQVPKKKSPSFNFNFTQRKKEREKKRVKKRRKRERKEVKRVKGER